MFFSCLHESCNKLVKEQWDSDLMGFSDSKQLFLIVSFVQLQIIYLVIFSHMADGSCTGTLPLRVLFAFIELSLKFCLVSANDFTTRSLV